MLLLLSKDVTRSASSQFYELKRHTCSTKNTHARGPRCSFLPRLGKRKKVSPLSPCCSGAWIGLSECCPVLKATTVPSGAARRRRVPAESRCNGARARAVLWLKRAPVAAGCGDGVEGWGGALHSRALTIRLVATLRGTINNSVGSLII